MGSMKKFTFEYWYESNLPKTGKPRTPLQQWEDWQDSMDDEGTIEVIAEDDEYAIESAEEILIDESKGRLKLKLISIEGKNPPRRAV